MAPDSPNRRTFVRGAGLAVAALAGCVTGDTPGTDSAPTAARSESPTPTGSATSTPDPTQTETPTETYPDHPWFRAWGETFDSFDAFDTDWSVHSGTADLAADAFDEGSAVRMDTAGGSRARIVREFDAPRDFSDRDFSLAVKLHSTTKPLVQLRLVLEDSSGARRYHSGSIQPAATDRWLRLDVGVENDDALDPSSVSEMWIEHWAGDAESVFSVDDLRTVSKPDVGSVIFSFSNEEPADYTVTRDVLSEYGYAGVCFPTLSTIGEGKTPSSAAFREMYEDGWDVGGHTTRHQRLSDHSKAEQREIFEENAGRLSELGLADEPMHFRAPYANYDANTLDVVLDAFDTCVSGAGSATGTNYRITDPRMIGFRSGNDLTDAKACVDAATNYRQLLGLTIRMEDVDRADLETLVEHVHRDVNQGKLEVVTMTDLYEASLA